MKKLEEYVVSIPDYPEKGIIFRDVTSILEDPEGLQLSIRELQDKLGFQHRDRTGVQRIYFWNADCI